MKTIDRTQESTTTTEDWDSLPQDDHVEIADVGASVVLSSVWITDPPAENRATFHALSQEWKKQTAGLPRVIDKIGHESYAQIISLGMEAVPHILADLQKGDDPAHWFEALRQITGADPIPEGDRGDLNEMAKAWIRWGRNRMLTN